MTDQTPIKRAAAAIDENYNPDQAPILAAMFQDYAHAAFESIDTDELANAMLDVRSKEIPALYILGSDYEEDRLDALELAHTIKNWLTGKDTQQ